MRCSDDWLTRAVIGVMVGSGSGVTLAESALPEPALREQAVQLEEQALSRPPPAWLTNQSGALQAWFERLRDSEMTTADQMSAPLRMPDGTSSDAVDASPTLTILASRALGDAQLRELFVQAAGRPDVRIVFRGVAPGESLGAFIRGIHALLYDTRGEIASDALPTIAIDPRLFQIPLVEVVPTLILTDGAGKELARVSGISRPDWLLEQVGQGRRGDLGVRGPTVAISEPDLIGELQRRLSGIDWNAQREAALAHYWERASFAELPTVEQVRERRLDLTLIAQTDVTLSDGTTVIRAGERVDPLTVMPFRQRLFVFDATDPRQVAEVVRRGAASRAAGTPPLYLATRLDRTAGWAGYWAVQAAVGDPLYLLTPDVQRRFRIERVPAMVESRDGVLVVSEWVPEG